MSSRLCYRQQPTEITGTKPAYTRYRRRFHSPHRRLAGEGSLIMRRGSQLCASESVLPQGEHRTETSCGHTVRISERNGPAVVRQGREPADMARTKRICTGYQSNTLHSPHRRLAGEGSLIMRRTIPSVRKKKPADAKLCRTFPSAGKKEPAYARGNASEFVLRKMETTLEQIFEQTFPVVFYVWKSSLNDYKKDYSIVIQYLLLHILQWFQEKVQRFQEKTQRLTEKVERSERARDVWEDD